MFRYSALWLAVGIVFGQSLDHVIIPRKTEFFITLERSISTQTARSGDKFYGRIAVPVTLDAQIVVPVGSYIIGQVDMSKEPGYMKGKAQVQLKFDTIILPNGTTRKMIAIVQSAEGYQTSLSEEKGTLESSGSQTKETVESAAGGTAGGATIGAIAARSWKGAGVGSVVGAAGGTLLGILQKGKHIVLPKGTSVTIQLEDNMGFVKPIPRNSGKPPTS